MAPHILVSRASSSILSSGISNNLDRCPFLGTPCCFGLPGLPSRSLTSLSLRLTCDPPMTLKYLQFPVISHLRLGSGPSDWVQINGSQNCFDHLQSLPRAQLVYAALCAPRPPFPERPPSINHRDKNPCFQRTLQMN